MIRKVFRNFFTMYLGPGGQCIKLVAEPCISSPEPTMVGGENFLPQVVL